MRAMRIGELAALTGVSTTPTRYYKDLGPMPPPERAPNGYRDYGEDAVDRLRFIRDAQATGLTLTEIASILELREEGQPTCEHVAELLEQHLKDLDAQIATLQATREHLATLTERARRLDPATCTDPVRCQTIAEATDLKAARRLAQPHAHHHG